MSQQLDFEIEESPEMEISEPPIQFEGASKDLEEQPHVQLRILELPSNEMEKDIISLMGRFLDLIFLGWIKYLCMIVRLRLLATKLNCKL